MVNAGTRIALSSPPRVSFSNLPAGTTTTNFELPAGVGEVQYNPVDPNNAGTLTLTDPNLFTYTLTTGIGGIPGATGSVFFQTLGGKTFNINVTAAAQSIVIYFADQVDGE